MAMEVIYLVYLSKHIIRMMGRKRSLWKIFLIGARHSTLLDMKPQLTYHGLLSF